MQTNNSIRHNQIFSLPPPLPPPPLSLHLLMPLSGLHVRIHSQRLCSTPRCRTRTFLRSRLPSFSSRPMLRWRGELIRVARPWKLRSAERGEEWMGWGGQLVGGPMATQCDMIDWGCQRCPAGRRRTATNKGLHRLAVTPPRQRRRHCWSPHQSTKGEGGH